MNDTQTTVQAVLCGHCKFYTPLRWIYGYSKAREGTSYIIVENDEGWGADMGPEFGCVLGELKDAGR